ncbi:MAG: hypothetical protein AABX97_00150 [Candidatus Thermoplasmatota archaeon]
MKAQREGQSVSQPHPQIPRSPPCDVCGGPTYERNCKTVCRRCGFTRDCSDP